MASPDVPNVQQSIALVMEELPAIGKDQRAAAVEGGYAYRGIEAIAKHLQPLLAKHGVVISPLSHLITQTPSIAMKEGWTDTILDVEWRIYGPAADFIEARTQGIGRDKSDKGAAKALTQARKNLLLSLFSIADKADDADGQTYEHDRTQEEPAASTDVRQEVLNSIGKLSDADKAKVKEWFADNKVPSLTKPGATNTQLNALADYITQLTTEPFAVDPPPDPTNAPPVPPGPPARGFKPDPDAIPFEPVVAFVGAAADSGTSRRQNDAAKRGDA